MSIRLSIKSNTHGLQRILGDLAVRLTTLAPVMRDIGEIVLDHVKDNFREGTTPEGRRWKPSHRALREGGKTLIDTGVLRNSFHVRPASRTVLVGTPDVRAPIHQFGAQAGSLGFITARVREHFRHTKSGGRAFVRAHTRRQRIPWGDIPARPFLPDPHAMPEDLADRILESLREFLMFGS